jgi:hypothetical protein
LVQILSENPQYKLFKQDLLLKILAAPFGAPAAQEVRMVFGRILLERGVGHLQTEQIEGTLNSAVSLLAIEAVRAKGKGHGWLGEQVEVAHGLLVRALQQHSPEVQDEWVRLCQIPDALLRLGLPHPEYGRCVAPGVFRYENQILMLKKGEFLKYLRQSSFTPAQTMGNWLAQEIPFLFNSLNTSLKEALQRCYAIQVIDGKEELLSRFLL